MNNRIINGAILSLTFGALASCHSQKTATGSSQSATCSFDSLQRGTEMEITVDEWYFYHDSISSPLSSAIPLTQDCGFGGNRVMKKGRKQTVASTAASPTVRHITVKRSASSTATTVTAEKKEASVTTSSSPAGMICRRMLLVAAIAATVALFSAGKRYR